LTTTGVAGLKKPSMVEYAPEDDDPLLFSRKRINNTAPTKASITTLDNFIGVRQRAI
jgi:hypothetical protein